MDHFLEHDEMDGVAPRLLNETTARLYQPFSTGNKSWRPPLGSAWRNEPAEDMVNGASSGRNFCLTHEPSRSQLTAGRPALANLL